MKKLLLVFWLSILFITNGADANGGDDEEIKEVIIFEKLSKEEINFLIAEHNRARADVGVPPLEWSEALSLYAEKWADFLAESSCILSHRPGEGKWKQKYGENLFMGVAGLFDVLHTVTVWESEKKRYHNGPVEERMLESTGNYTQVIWKDTKYVGCGKAICSGNVVVVCNYDPPGNIVGEKPF